jgi:hypothetical protein
MASLLGLYQLKQEVDIFGKRWDGLMSGLAYVERRPADVEYDQR